MKEDMLWGFVFGMMGATTLFIMVANLADYSKRKGCERTTFETCLKIEYLSESQVDALKKMQNIKHPNGSPEQ